MAEIQIIKCRGGKPFAACRVPECYEDAEWMKELRKYVKSGCTVEIIQSQNSQFLQNCECGVKSGSCKLLSEKIELTLF